MLPKKPRYTLYTLILIALSVVGSTAVANSNVKILFDEVVLAVEKVVTTSFSEDSGNTSQLSKIEETVSSDSAKFSAPMFMTIIQGADEEVGCSDNGFTVARFNLCGDSDNRTVSLSGGPYGSVSWQILGGSCSPDINEDCPNTGSCYSQVATGQTFNINAASVPSTVGAEYRVVADGQIFYFKVKKSTITQTFVKQDFICGVPGRIQITNLSSAYEFSINGGITWQTAIFPNLDPGTYNILARLRNTPNTCEYPYPPITIDQQDIEIEATFVDAQCSGDTGSITVTANNVPGPFKYTLLNSSGVAQEFTAFISDNPYTFSAVGFGTYIVQVETQQCQGDPLNGIDPPRQNVDTSGNPITIGAGLSALDASTEVNSSFGCSTISSVDITLNVDGGSGPYTYTVNGGPVQPSFGSSATNTGTTTYAVTTAGTYDFVITDSNGCDITASSNVEELLPPDVTVAGIDGTCSNGGAQIEFTVNDARGYNLSYRVNTGDPWVTTPQISVPAGTYNDIEVRYQQGGFECTISLPPVTVTNVGVISGSANKIADVTCNGTGGTNSGQIDFVGPFSGGSGSGYVFSIDGVNFTGTTSYAGLAAGIYTPIIRDSGGCRLELTPIEILDVDPPTNIDFAQSNTNCAANTSDVQLTATANFAIATYEVISPLAINNGTNDTFTGLTNNVNHVFRITDVNGCTYEESFTPAVISSIRARLGSGGDLRVCTGATDGDATFLVDGFANSYSYSVSPGGFSGTGETNLQVPISGLGANTYTITVTDDDTGCTDTASVTVVEPSAALSLTATVTAMSCANNNIGLVRANASGGYGSYRYELEWPTPPGITQGPKSGRNFGNLTAEGTYTLTVTDVEGCTTSTTFVLNQVDPPSIALGTVDYCYGPGDDASIQVSSTAGSAAISTHQYRINGGSLQASPNFNGLVPGTYTIEVVDGNNCTDDLTVTIPPQIQITLDLVTEIPCGGDGEMGITVNGGDISTLASTSYTIFLDGTPVAGHTGNNLPSSTFNYTVPFGSEGTYTVEVTDNNGCTNTSPPLTFTPPASITATAVPVGSSCGDSSSGYVEIIPDVSTGTPAFEIVFAPQGTGLVDSPFNASQPAGFTYSSQTIYSGLSAGTYEYIVKDARNCTTGVQTITVVPDSTNPPDATVSSIDADCDVTGVSGGVRVDSIADGVASFIIIIEDNFGNEIIRRENVGLGDLPLDIEDPLLVEGNYTVITLDSRGCLDLDAISINSIDLQIVPDFTVPIVCDRGNLPQCVDIVNGVGPFDIRLVTDPVSPYIDLGPTATRYCFPDLVPGASYTVQVLDQGTGCEYIEEVTVPDGPNPLDVSLSIDNGNCNGEDVELRYIISGAAGPFDIVIRNLDTGAIVTNVTASTVADNTILVPQGPYAISVIDNATDCTGGDTIEATLNMPRVDVINNENANCNEDGQLTFRGSGGNPYPPSGAGSLPDGSPYEYAVVVAGSTPGAGDYSTVTTVALPGSLAPGTAYDIFVRDSRGCEFMTSATIVQLDPDLPLPSISVNNQCITGAPPASFQIDVTMPANIDNPTFTLGGQTLVPAYDGINPTTATFSVPSIGVYDVYVVDSNGCDVSTTAEVFQILSASADFSTEPSCNNNDGIITVTPNGGSGNFTFELRDGAGTSTGNSTGATNGIFTGVGPGDYEVFIRDDIANDGSVFCDFTVDGITLDAAIPPVIIDMGESNISCNGANDGSISVILNPGSDVDGILEYRLFDSSNTEINSNISGSFTGLTPDTYRVEVETDRGCIDDETIAISEPPTFEISATDATLVCENGANRFSTATISATLVSIGNGGPYGYRLDPGDSYQSSPDFDIVDNGTDQTITIYAIDANGCEDDVTITVFAPTDVVSSISQDRALTCADPERVEITVTGTTNFTVITSGPSGTTVPNVNQPSGNSIFVDLPSVGDYLIEVQDNSAGGCSYPLPVYTVNPPTEPTVVISEANPVRCFGASDGALNIEVSNYVGTRYSYQAFLLDVGGNRILPAEASGNFDTSVANPETILGLPGGNYVVDIVSLDDPQCPAISNVANIRTPNGPLTVNAVPVGNVGCNNDLGEIEATGQGGWDSFPYEYRLLFSTDGGVTYTTEVAPFSPNNEFTGLQFGFYRVEIQDIEVCINTFDIELEEVPQIDAGIREPQGLDCPNGNNAVLEAYDPSTGDAITATPGATGGFAGAGYNYRLLYLNSNDNTDIVSASGLQNSPTFIGSSGGFISAGWYAIEVSSSFDCIHITEPYFVDPPPPVVPLLVQTRVPGCGGDGEMRLTIENPDPLFTYEYAPVENGVIVGPYLPMVGTSVLIPGVQGITYQFDVRKTSALSICLPVRSNGITMTNATGITILPNLPDDISCASELDGRIESFVNGGVGDDLFYLYVGDPLDAFTPAASATLFRGPQPDGTFEGLPEGNNYYIAVTSGATCMDIAGPFEIIRPAPIVFDATPTPVTCNGEEDGSITVEVISGGVGLIQFAIAPNFNEFFSDPATPGTYTFDELATGTYEILIQDENGCFEKDFITVDEPEIVEVINIQTTPELCIGANDGTVVFDIIGGTPFNDPLISPSPYFEYKLEMIDPIDETGTAVFAPYDGQIIQNLQGGASYALYIQDANLCPATQLFTVDIGVDLTAEPIVQYGCEGIFPNSTTTVQMQDASLMSDLMFALDPVDPTDAITAMAGVENVWGDLPAGDHIVYIYHENGCSNFVEFSVDSYDPLTLNAMKTGPNELVASAEGGYGGYEYFFNGESYGEETTYTTNESGMVNIRVVDANGCVAEVAIPFEFTGMLEIPNFFTPDGDNQNDFWAPRNREFFPDIEVKIYDRYGRVVAILDEVSGWDGKYEGNEVPTGDYWYVVNANDKSKQRYVGHFTLYR
ncbi:T9SS type B sorting domain-containing protein [Maribacter aestuarii]|uniref:T9SS type B sorting domain-containing protein n=1 Tax=Maribacter aestuarii TaxID=1130723 RepID=UPI00248B94B6|nr:T9SS type B sorting domain-containing protein [Maribacter aestuarii]